MDDQRGVMCDWRGWTLCWEIVDTKGAARIRVTVTAIKPGIVRPVFRDALLSRLTLDIDRAIDGNLAALEFEVRRKVDEIEDLEAAWAMPMKG